MSFTIDKKNISTASLKSRLLFAVFISLVLFSSACEKKSVPMIVQTVPVEVAKAETADVPLKIQSIGTVEPVQTAAIGSQVGGYLLEVLIKDGQPVEQGQVLFRIDSRKFEVALRQIEATSEQIKIQWKNAAKEAERAESLLKDNVITPQEYERLQTAADSLKATLGVQDAMLESARLDLSFCTIRSPISGRAGSLLVHKGDLIKANTTIFVTINQIDPISARFSIPEKDLGAVRAAMAAGSVNVSAALPQNDGNRAEGELVAIDNTVDVQTGSIILKAEFANESELLWPGQFVEVSLVLGAVKDAVVIPSKAVQTGQQGAFVFVLDEQKKARLRRVVQGFAYGDRTIITDGLKAEETVVIDGQVRLGDGTPVEIKKVIEAVQEKSE